MGRPRPAALARGSGKAGIGPRGHGCGNVTFQDKRLGSSEMKTGLSWKTAFQPKSVEKDTGWKQGKVPPRHAPIFPKSKPLGPAWEWRSLHLDIQGMNAVCHFQVSAAFGKWKAYLLVESSPGIWTALMRYEDQPRQSGLHVHGACDGQDLTGPASINMPDRVPAHRSRHRRQVTWTRQTFFRAACDFYRILNASVQMDIFDDT